MAEAIRTMKYLKIFHIFNSMNGAEYIKFIYNDLVYV